MKITVFWDVMSCSLVDGYHRFGRMRLHLQGRRVLWRRKQQSSPKHWLISYITQDSNFYSHHHENLKSHIATNIWCKPTWRPFVVVSEITLLVPGQEWISNLTPRFKNNKPFSKCSAATLYLRTKKIQVHCQAYKTTRPHYIISASHNLNISLQ
jgi:hypothetical protein